MSNKYKLLLKKVSENNYGWKETFAAAITLYNPTDEQIQRAISYSQTFDYVILLDNSDEYFDNNTLIIDMLNERCKYIRMSGNEGLSVDI